MSQAIEPEIKYYSTLNTLFGITSITVILLCLLSLPLFNLSESASQRYMFILVISAVMVIAKYTWLKDQISYNQGFYITDVLNPIMTGLLISASGVYGMYLFFLFFLQILGSLALFKFSHVLVSATSISLYTIYLFFFSDTLGIGQPESYVAGFVLLVVIFLIVVISYFIVFEQVRVMTELNLQKSKFIQDVSHELRTPLTVIKSVSTILTNTDWLNPSKNKKKVVDQRVFEYLQSAAADLETITERLSTQSRQKISATKHDQVMPDVSKKNRLQKLKPKGMRKKKD